MTTGRLRRVRVQLAAGATLAGWAAAAAVTALAFVLPELWRNALSLDRPRMLVEGAALWGGFTFAVCTVTWAAIMLPLSLWVPAGALLLHRRALMVLCPAAGMLVVCWRLDVWHSLKENPAESPLDSLLLWNYATFAAVFAWVTTAVYLRRLRRLVGWTAVVPASRT